MSGTVTHPSLSMSKRSRVSSQRSGGDAGRIFGHLNGTVLADELQVGGKQQVRLVAM